MNYYERHLGDYARDAGHLSMLEHGAYCLLLDRYYITEQGIPADQAHRLCRAKTRDERAAVDAVLAEFFTLTNGAWVNGRAEREIVKMQTKIKAARENGKAGGRPRRTNQEPTGLFLGSESVTQEKALQTPDTSQVSEIPSVVAAKTPRPTKKAPPGFLLSAELRAWAEEHAPHCDPAVELEKLKDHTFATARTDWAGTLRNWLRKAEENHASAPRAKVVGLNGDQWAGAI